MDTRDGGWASRMDTPIVHITVTVMADTMEAITVAITPTTPTMDTVMEVTMVVAVMEATMETTILIPITGMEGWIADIPTDIPIDPKRPLVAPSDPLPETPGTEAVPPHQQNQQLPHGPTQE